MKSPITYYGGKTMLAKTISDYAPLDFSIYLEPFFGSGAFFFHRKKWAKTEIINDINGDVVNFFRVLRDKPQKLIEALHLTPFARQEIKDSTSFIKSKKSNDVTRALYFFVRANQSFSANMRENGGWQIPNSKGKKAEIWKNKTNPQKLYQVAERLRHAAIENNPALYVAKLYDSPKTFIYLDPPYISVASARDKKTAYQGYDMAEGEHIDFISEVMKLKSKIIVSGYDNPIYNPLVENGWRKIIIDVTAPSGNKRVMDKKKSKRQEVLWISPNVSKTQMLLF